LVNNVIKVDDQILEAFFRINSTNNIPKKKHRFFKIYFRIKFLQVKPKREDPLHSDILRNALEELKDL